MNDVNNFKIYFDPWVKYGVPDAALLDFMRVILQYPAPSSRLDRSPHPD